jgi:hypothetical protein
VAGKVLRPDNGQGFDNYNPYKMKLYSGVNAMPKPTEPKSAQNPTQAAEHVASAHQILKDLQQKVGSHPEIGEAITKLEMALNILAVQTGGLL